MHRKVDLSLASATAVDWQDRPPPNAEAVLALADAAYRDIPAAFRRACAGLVIQILEFADTETLSELGADSRWDILGLFAGTGLTQRDATPRTGEFPNVIHLYRAPILRYWLESGETLGDIVTHVLVHEIGHHFGLSDEDMDRIDHSRD